MILVRKWVYLIYPLLISVILQSLPYLVILFLSGLLWSSSSILKKNWKLTRLISRMTNFRLYPTVSRDGTSSHSSDRKGPPLCRHTVLTTTSTNLSYVGQIRPRISVPYKPTLWCLLRVYPKLYSLYRKIPLKLGNNCFTSFLTNLGPFFSVSFKHY